MLLVVFCGILLPPVDHFSPDKAPAGTGTRPYMLRGPHNNKRNEPIHKLNCYLALIEARRPTVS